MTATNVSRLVKRLLDTRWTRLHSDGWADDTLLSYPGAYLLAYTNRDLSRKKIKIDDVYYVGMSNSAGRFGAWSIALPLRGRGPAFNLS